jgi:transcriptional regulator with XRE-family HTH domain
MNKILDFLKEINGGILYGSQAKLMRDIGTDSSTVNRYARGSLKPSENHLKKMSKKYKKTEEELKDIFDIKEKAYLYQSAEQIHNGHGDQIMHHTDIEIFYEKFKVIEAKLDLLIARSGNK